MTEPLTITTSPRTDHQLDLTIQLGPERTEEALRRAAKQVAQKVNIPGFRRGKAPYATVVRHFGREALLNEIMDDLGQEVYQEALITEQLQPYSQAQVEDIELDPPTFKLVVPLPPEVDLAEYRGVRVEESTVEVGDADVEKVIAEQRANRATWLEIDRPAEMGDTVTIDIHGTAGDDTIMDNHDWDLQLKEESGWLPGFAEAFVGMKAGDEKTFALKYPEDSASRYKGQEVTFQATVKQVKARLEPELDDEFAKSLGDYADVADLRSKLQEQLLRQRTNEAESKLNEAALEAIIAQAHLSYPPTAVDETLDGMLDEVRRNLTRAGYGLEDYVRLQGMSMEQYRAQLRPQAEKRLQGRLVLSKLAEAEQIQVTPEDLTTEMDRIAPSESEDEQAKALREALQTPAGQAVIRQDVLTDKTLARLRAIVTGKAPELAAPEAQAETAAPAANEAGPAEGQAETAAPMTEETAAPAAGEVGLTETPEPPTPASEPAQAESAPTESDEILAYESGTAMTEVAQAIENEEQTKAEEE